MYINKCLKFFLIVFALFFGACQPSEKLPDVSTIEVKVELIRFDQELAQLQETDIANQHERWKIQYGQFYEDFIEEMLEAGFMEDEGSLLRNWAYIVNQKDFQVLSQKVEERFPDLNDKEKELEEAFKYLRYYFPEYEMPVFYSFFSGFSSQVAVGEGYVGIGLDMFLGVDSEFYPALIESIPMYISRRFTPENIVPRVIESVLRVEISDEEPLEGNTLAHMVHHGKILYALDKILPHTPDTLKLGYTEEQLTWADAYRKDIWAWFVSEDILYSTDYLRNQSYFSEAPFTPELGENNESAPKLGTYIGWQMVRRFMEKNRDVTISELMSMTDAQMILEKSGFRGE